MLVTGRDPDGAVQLWRVGRRRIAWRPRSAIIGLAHDEGDMFPTLPGRLAFQLLEWVPALAATAVVWPWRVHTGRWPVVAYTLGMADQAGYRYEEVVVGRAEADASARHWAEEIRRYGRPQSREPDETVPDRTHLLK
ncbi:hypothetical protein [Catellatospora sp. IY07-71]|uniref:hypothetical protein n=1 Tax=Catellatospora sp. IY07-71 TaxID=2728827 RepID=UPI001BB42C4A|nr:hypothetical protein [Catellatospora sp. IY07-71]